jgi:hypothetical protein
MKTLKIITLFTMLLNISSFAQNYECSANKKNQKPVIFKIENNSKGLFLKFDNTFLNREYKVDYQGWGAHPAAKALDLQQVDLADLLEEIPAKVDALLNAI